MQGRPRRVLFVCTGNSARSQMAEGFARALGLEARSAGTEPAPAVHPAAAAVMAECGIELSGHFPRLFDPAVAQAMDAVVTVCGDAEERCPALPPAVRRIHWPLPDPAKATGNPSAVLAVFRKVRDDIRRRVMELARDLSG